MFSYMILLYSLQVKTNVCYARYLVCQNTLSYNLEKSIEVIHYQQYCKKRCSHFTSKSSILQTSPQQKTECISNSFNIALRESIFIQKLNILPSLNVRLHINYHLYLKCKIAHQLSLIPFKHLVEEILIIPVVNE